MKLRAASNGWTALGSYQCPVGWVSPSKTVSKEGTWILQYLDPVWFLGLIARSLYGHLRFIWVYIHEWTLSRITLLREVHTYITALLSFFLFLTMGGKVLPLLEASSSKPRLSCLGKEEWTVGDDASFVLGMTWPTAWGTISLAHYLTESNADHTSTNITFDFFNESLVLYILKDIL